MGVHMEYGICTYKSVYMYYQMALLSAVDELHSAHWPVSEGKSTLIQNLHGINGDSLDLSLSL